MHAVYSGTRTIVDVRDEGDVREAEVGVREQQRHHADQLHHAVGQLREFAGASNEPSFLLVSSLVRRPDLRLLLHPLLRLQHGEAWTGVEGLFGAGSVASRPAGRW